MEPVDNTRGRLSKFALRFISENSFTYKIFFGPDPHRVRPKVILLLSGLSAVQIIVWVIAVIVYKPYPSMIGTGALAYTLGLRHAVDAGNSNIYTYIQFLFLWLFLMRYA